MRAVKKLRLKKGWSQKDLSERSGVGQDTISGVESGKHEPRPSTLRKLASALGVEVAEFFAETRNDEELTARPKELEPSLFDGSESTAGSPKREERIVGSHVEPIQSSAETDEVLALFQRVENRELTSEEAYEALKRKASA